MTILPGKTYTARNQGTAITPHSKLVHVAWVSDRDVHYYLCGEAGIKQTPLQRFIEIVGGPGLEVPA
jgi:hypothetical protein